MKGRPYEERQAETRIQHTDGGRERFVLLIHQSRPHAVFHPSLGETGGAFFTEPKTVIADAGYGSKEHYLFAGGEEKEPLFDFLIPYGSYLKENPTYKNDVRNAKNVCMRNSMIILSVQMAYH
ncbi:hypothetical protein [Fictibacillus solisalsi]|uniref:hypothetical protein n=1 Tax=Fictibacillus solisalsi TaxID=459525 RepID=UPI000B7E54B0|nr:hypothetical protein [Fictibacillus solisalsi]